MRSKYVLARVYTSVRVRERQVKIKKKKEKKERLFTMLLLMWRSNLYQTDNLIAFITLDMQQQSVDCSS